MDLIELRDADLWASAWHRFQTVVETTRHDWAAELLRRFPHRDLLHEIAEQLLLDLGASGVEVSSVTRHDQVTLAKAPYGLLEERGTGTWASAAVRIAGVDAGAVCTLEFDRSRLWNLREQCRIEEAARLIQGEVDHWFQGVNKGMFL